MDQLLSDLLAFSHLSQLKIELVPVSLQAAVDGAVTACEPDILKSRALVECLPPWPTVLAHAATLQQVLVNFISNALMFVADQPPHVRLWNEERPGGIVRMWIEDNDIGIPLESQERIFQVFQRLHTTQFTGTGIGLAIVQKGVERMAGRAGVESTPGQGRKFWIELAKAPDSVRRLP